MFKKLIILCGIVIFVVIVLVDSEAVYLRKTVEKRGEIEFDKGYFEWHPEKIPVYFKKAWENITRLLKKDEEEQ